MNRFKHKPPLIPYLFLSLFSRFSNDFSMLGDLDEEYFELLESRGALFAGKWYWRNFIKSFPPLLMESIYWSITMFGNYFKIALRNLFKNKSTSIINIAGLAFGMACSVLIFLWVFNQLSYDQNQVNKDNIYRMETNTWVVSPPYFTDITSVFPEVKEAVRFYFWWTPTLKHKETVFTINDFALCDSNVFKVFTFDFLLGSPDNALTNPYSIVLTESIANKLFGNEYPLGQKISLSNKYDYTVTAVVKDVKNMQLNINAFVNVTDMNLMNGNDSFLTARSNNFLIYLLLQPGVNIDNLRQKIFERGRDEFNTGEVNNFVLRPYNDIYFNNNLHYESFVKHGNYTLIIMFSVIAFLILLIACINFINLTIANTTTRFKEIAVRKVVGAQQASIRSQFFGEAFLVVIISFMFSLLITYSALPVFNQLTGENINFDLSDINLLLSFLGIVLFTTFISAGYPALYLSSLKPVVIFKGKNGTGKKEGLFSKVLISFQFAVSIFLIITTLSVVEQLKYVQETDLGMDQDQILTVTMRGDNFSGETQNILNNKKLFKQELMQYPAIDGVTYVAQLPGEITNTWSWYTDDPENTVAIKIINTNPDFASTLGLQIVKGRTHSFDMPTDLRNFEGTDKFVINETAAKELGLKDPVGKVINDGHIEIIGVVKDFHFNSLHTSIAPMAYCWFQYPSKALIKIKDKDIKRAMSDIESVYKEFCPGYGFEYDFLDASFARQYEADQRLESLLLYFVVIAIALSCLGLFALTSYMAKRRLKEIGIRKVLGASNSLIVFLISQSFIKWIIIGNLIAWPAAYFIIQQWLQNFAYHMDLNFATFLIGTLSALAVAFLTILYQALKAASLNPVVTLKTE